MEITNNKSKELIQIIRTNNSYKNINSLNNSNLWIMKNNKNLKIKMEVKTPIMLIIRIKFQLQRILPNKILNLT